MNKKLTIVLLTTVAIAATAGYMIGSDHEYDYEKDLAPGLRAVLAQYGITDPNTDRLLDWLAEAAHYMITGKEVLFDFDDWLAKAEKIEVDFGS